jgi:hypothetical protein
VADSQHKTAILNVECRELLSALLFWVGSMNKQQNRINLVRQIITAAKLYKQNLVGKKFLYIFDCGYIEVIFRAKDFRHLTGVDTNLSAMGFYMMACKGILTANQISFSSRHPYSTSVKKIKHLQNISTLVASECFMLRDITTNSETYKFGTTDLKFSLCFSKEYVDDNKSNECFIVKSLRAEDCFSKAKEVYTVTHIFSKRNDKSKYSKVIYLENNHSISTVPEELKPMLSDSLLFPALHKDCVEYIATATETSKENSECFSL